MLKRFLTFKDFLRIMSEDASTDADEMRGDIAMIDATVAARSKPLIQKKLLLMKQLAIKEKQAQSEAKKTPQGEEGEMAASQVQAKTPGSSGAGTPGVS